MRATSKGIDGLSQTFSFHACDVLRGFTGTAWLKTLACNGLYLQSLHCALGVDTLPQLTEGIEEKKKKKKAASRVKKPQFAEGK